MTFDGTTLVVAAFQSPAASTTTARAVFTDGGQVASSVGVVEIHTDDGSPYFTRYFRDDKSTSLGTFICWGDSSNNCILGTEANSGLYFVTNGYAGYKMGDPSCWWFGVRYGRYSRLFNYHCWNDCWFVPTACGRNGSGKAPLKFIWEHSILPLKRVPLSSSRMISTSRSRLAARQKVVLTTGLTAGRIPYNTTNGRLTDSTDLQYDGTNIILSGLKYPNADGTAGFVLKTDGAKNLGWVAQSGATGPTGATGPAGGGTPIISTNTTLYVATTGNDTTGNGTSGAPWATVAKAVAYLYGYWISPSVNVTIMVADGTYSWAETTFQHPCGQQIQITGTNTYSPTVSSVQSSSGSSGAWSYILNVSSVANIAVNDYVILSGASGGTKPRNLQGVHKVTNVDAGNTRITVLSKFRSATVASGAVTANILVLKTIITVSGTNAFTIVSGPCGWIRKMALVGNGTCCGIAVGGAGLCGFGQLGVTGFANGIYASGNGTAWSDGTISACSGNASGFVADNGSEISRPPQLRQGTLAKGIKDCTEA